MKRFFFSLLATVATTTIFAQWYGDTLLLTEYLDDIVVTAQVAQPTTNHEVVNSKQLDERNSGQNLPYLLSATPSLLSFSEDGLGIGYTHFRVRGTDESRINMTVNNVPLNDGESSTVFWINMTDFAGSLSDVNVQRGVGTSTNGGAAFGASINMNTLSNTKKADLPTSVQIDFNGGMYNTFREKVSADVKLPHNMRVQARLSKVNTDGYRDRAKSDLFSYYGALGYYGKKTTIAFTTFGGVEKTYVAWHGITEAKLKWDRTYNPAGEYIDKDGNVRYYDNNYDHYHQQHYQLNWKQRFNQLWQLSVTAHYTYGKGYTEEIKADKKYSKYGLPDYVTPTGEEIKRTNMLRQKHLKNHFFGAVAEATYKQEQADFDFGVAANHYIGKHFGYVQDYLYNSVADFDHEYYNNNASKTTATVYAKANWRAIHQAKRKLTVYGDLQYRYVNYRIDGKNDDDDTQAMIHFNEHFHFFNPKAGITYEDHGHLAYFTIAVANREPARKNYTESGMQDKPKSELMHDYELGYQYRHRRFSVGINLYYMDYFNQLVTSGVLSRTGSMLTINVDRSYRMGLELTANVEIQKWLHWQGTMTLSRNIIKNFTDSVYRADWSTTRHNFGDKQIAFSPWITAVSSLTFTYAGLTADIRTQVVGHQYVDNTESADAKLPAYTTTDLNLSYSLPLPERWPRIILKTQVNNLFNSHYCSAAYVEESTLQPDGSVKHDLRYFPQAGINVHAGFCVRW